MVEGTDTELSKGGPANTPPRADAVSLPDEISNWVLREIAKVQGGIPSKPGNSFTRAVRSPQAFAKLFNDHAAHVGWPVSHLDPDDFKAKVQGKSVKAVIAYLCGAIRRQASRLLSAALDDVYAEIDAWARGEIAKANSIDDPTTIDEGRPFKRFVDSPKAFATCFNTESGERPAWGGREVDPDDFSSSASGGTIAQAIGLLYNSLTPMAAQ